MMAQHAQLAQQQDGMVHGGKDGGYDRGMVRLRSKQEV